MRVLFAFDKFKDSISAREACDIAAAALSARHPDWQLESCPLADGGEGFCEILTQAAGGTRITSSVTDPLGRPVQAPIGVVPLARIPAGARDKVTPRSTPVARSIAAVRNTASIAVIEMASASGLALLEPDERDPWQTTSAGTGELIRMAADLGVASIVLGIGGSATSDLGLGALAMLGLEFRAADGRPVSPPVPEAWPQIAEISGRIAANLPPIFIACDVTNPLLGARGAAAVYGPQKGLRANDVARLDHECSRLGLMLCHHCDAADALMEVPGAGAAGGISFGLMAAAGAELLPGFELVSEWLDLERKIAAADIVITGEGRFDDSSLSGKGPGAVAARALALGKRVHVFAGQATTRGDNPALAVQAITPAGMPLETALLTASGNLAAAIARTF